MIVDTAAIIEPRSGPARNSERNVEFKCCNKPITSRRSFQTRLNSFLGLILVSMSKAKATKKSSMVYTLADADFGRQDFV